jgi:hypothetical protein
MKRSWILLLSAGLLVGLSGCCGGANPNAANPNLFGAAPETCRPVYRSPCDEMCSLGDTIAATHNDLFGCNPAPEPVSLAPEPVSVTQCNPADLPKDAKCGETWCCVLVQPPAAPPERVCTCPEQVIEIPIAATFETIERQEPDQPARCEWQQVPCESQPGAECWKLTEIPATFKTVYEQRMVTPPSVRREVIPAKFEMRMSAPPPAYYEWRLVEDCVMTVPSAIPPADDLSEPPAGSADYPIK